MKPAQAMLSAAAFMTLFVVANILRNCISPRQPDPTGDSLLAQRFARDQAGGIGPEATVQQAVDRVAQVLSQDELKELQDIIVDAGLTLPDDEAARLFELKARQNKTAEEYLEWNKLFRRALLGLPADKQKRYSLLSAKGQAAVKGILKQDR